MVKQTKQQALNTSQEEATERKLRHAIGDVLRTHRKAKKLTQQELGIVADTDPIYISRIESGKHSPTIATLFKLAPTLDVTPWDFIKEVADKLATTVE